ncbi:cytochrome P460 family protein [Shewanella sp. NR704-98]|uniref:Cytochrome P460 family protein n=2 Tax=Shewanella nanhaiensis TaxID=2864872 RepID=A0ABS7E294_9GAMM|nr:cytochrome P460 family protein [Shewanella nanhaiensis]
MNCSAIITLGLLLVGFSTSSLAKDHFSADVDDKGNISFPANYRSTMEHLGSWFVPTGGASGFHHVYTERESVAYFQQHGVFPDGAVLVKELLVSEANNYTTGEGVHSANGEYKQWFVMVKDSQNRFADNPVWGEGWGWALFKPGNTSKNLATDYKADCLACHVPAKETDWIYTQAYPALSE